MPNRFSDVTERIQKKLPYWMKKMRNTQDSIGSQFLNVFGLAIEDVEFIMNYAYDQTNLRDIDNEQIDIIYKLFIPDSINNLYNIMINSENHILVEVDNLNDFFVKLSLDGNNSEVDYPNPFFVDYLKHVIYVRYPYDANEQYKYGVVNVKIYNEQAITIFNDDVKLYIHPVWNFFDEFGLLLATPRLNSEPNIKYKERLLDVFKHKANASLEGLMNGIARELGLRRNFTWDNGDLDYIIEDTGVIINSIEIDGVKIDQSLIFVNKNTGKLTLKGDIAWTNTSRDLSYIYGFNMQQLHNKDDLRLQNQIDEPGKPLLEFIKEELKVKAPILWNNFIWDQNYWDIITETTEFIPPKLDGRI